MAKGSTTKCGDAVRKAVKSAAKALGVTSPKGNSKSRGLRTAGQTPTRQVRSS